MNNKDLEILQYFQSQGQTPITLKELAHKFKVSERSIRNYIDRINETFRSEKIRLDKGSYHIEDLDFIEQYLDKTHPAFFSAELKEKYIFYTLLLYRYINLTQISEELQISRSSSKQHFEKIKKQLASHGLEVQIEHKKGLMLYGPEEKIRKLQLHILVEYESLSKVSKKVLEDVITTYKEGIDEKVIDRFIDQITTSTQALLADQAYQVLRAGLLVMVHELQHDNTLTNGQLDFFLTSCKEFEVIRQWAPILEKGCQIQLNDHEIASITDLFLGVHFSPNTAPEQNEWFEYDLLISKMIQLYSRYARVNLSNDRKLYTSLLTHIKPMIYRMTNGIRLIDIDGESIAQEYAMEYELTRRVLNELGFFRDDTAKQYQAEIALLTIHFKASANRVHAQEHAARKKVLIVCAHGYGTSKLIEQQLMEIYDIEVLNCIPYHYLKQYPHLDDVQLIITTVPQLQEFESIPVVHLNTVLKQEDFDKLDVLFHKLQIPQVPWKLLCETIGTYAEIHDENALKTALQDLLPAGLIQDEKKQVDLLRYLPAENIVRLHSVPTWQEALQISGELLIRNHYVTEQYVQDMVESFKNYGSYMIIDEGIAIPHTRNDHSVLKTGVSLLVLDEPVYFTDGQPLQILFSFCSKDNSEHLDALVCIANLVSNPSFKNEIFQCATPWQIHACIQNYIQDMEDAS